MEDGQRGKTEGGWVEGGRDAALFGLSTPTLGANC